MSPKLLVPFVEKYLSWPTALLLQGVVKRIGNGESTRFWTDYWLGSPIINEVDQSSGAVDLNERVADYISAPGVWNADLLFSSVPSKDRLPFAQNKQPS